LWSDGAEKSRYIYLPPNTKIDTTDMDDWVFPIGTRIWKEFRVGTSTNWNGLAAGTRIETRLLQKVDVPSPVDSGWVMTSYLWSADGETSASAATSGVQNWRGTTYEVPSADRGMCWHCHKGRGDAVLGFEAVALSTPMSQIDGLTPAMDALVRNGLLSVPPSAPIEIPGDTTEALTLGYLHAGCGICCHNRSQRADAMITGLFMRLDVATLASAQATDLYNTAIRVRAHAQPSPAPNPPWFRIDPGRPDRSVLYWRDGTRNSPRLTSTGERIPMPPVCTHFADAQGLATIKAWILALPR
jgi:hypothetical protein